MIGYSVKILQRFDRHKIGAIDHNREHIHDRISSKI